MRRVNREATLKRELPRVRSYIVSDEEIGRFTETGKLTITDALSDASFKVVTNACKRLLRTPGIPKTREIRTQPWRNVDKVTLFDDPRGPKQKTHSARLHAPELAAAGVWADGIVRTLGTRLLQLDHKDAGEALLEHQTNRVVIHRMKGVETSYGENLSIIPRLPAPLPEHGTVVSLAIGSPIDIETRQVVAPNTVDVYACSDLSEVLGIEQPRYGFRSNSTEISVLFTQFEG